MEDGGRISRGTPHEHGYEFKTIKELQTYIYCISADLYSAGVNCDGSDVVGM